MKRQNTPRSSASKLPGFKTKEEKSNPGLLGVLTVKRDKTSEGAQDFLGAGLLSVSRVSPDLAEHGS